MAAGLKKHYWRLRSSQRGQLEAPPLDFFLSRFHCWLDDDSARHDVMFWEEFIHDDIPEEKVGHMYKMINDIATQVIMLLQFAPLPA
eukprot:TRINITY_DN72161_c0_g1_i1.p1 TRINITY_DN72161_c0_g1~~TRINITY_DN72161_c0_g1_i1.p1  ORF type:complete len:101 (-),score=27.81 TRINITY_DN72161_c0_g1_i1:58-318(-)